MTGTGKTLQRGEGNGCCGLYFWLPFVLIFFFCSNQFIVLTSAFLRCAIFIQPPEKVKGFLGWGCVFAYTCLIELSNKIMSSA